jgi:long-chain acyl-CoA synthetase
VIAILGDNRPEWVFAEWAAQALGGACLGVHPDLEPAALGPLLEACDATVALAEGQEQVDKLLACNAKGLARILWCRPRGLRRYQHASLQALEQLEAQGRALRERDPGRFAREAATGSVDELAFLCAGPAGGAPLRFTYRDLAALAAALHAEGNRGEEAISFLPLSWPGEQAVSVQAALACGFCVNFPESPETTRADLHEIGPQVLFAPPRLWEGVHQWTVSRLSAAAPFNQWMSRVCLPIGAEAAAARAAGAVSLGLRLRHLLAEVFFFWPLRDRLGFARVRRASTGGAPLPPEVDRFLAAIGLTVSHAPVAAAPPWGE